MIVELTQDYLKSLLRYDEESGNFHWLENRRHGMKDNIAGYKHKSNGKFYVRISIDNNNYSAHRLAVLYMTGKPLLSGYHTDHIDGDGSHNAWLNLRTVTRSENQRNRRLSSTNKSGITGVFWDIRNSVWRASLQIKPKTINLGSFKDFFEACCARKSAEIQHAFHPNHGSVRPL